MRVNAKGYYTTTPRFDITLIQRTIQLSAINNHFDNVWTYIHKWCIIQIVDNVSI